MSIMNQLRGSSVSDKNDWTQEDMKLAVGIKLLGGKRKDIVIALKDRHPENSVTYLFTRKLSEPDLDENGNQKTEQRQKKVKGELQFNEDGTPIMVTHKLRRQLTDAELFACLGVSGETAEQCVEQIIAFTKAKIQGEVEEAEEEVIGEEEVFDEPQAG